MALDKTVVPVVFQNGLNTGTAEEVVVPGEFLVLENAVRRTKALLEKRYGFNALGKAIISQAAEVTSGVELTRFNNDLVLLNQTRVYSFSPANDAWSDRGPITSTLVGSEPVIRNTYTQAMPDSTHNGGITATVWEDERGGVRCSVVVDETGAPTIYDVELNGSGSRPKVVAIGSYLVFVYIVGTDIRTRRVSIAVPNTVETEVVAYGGVALDEPMDVVPYLSGAVLVFNDTSNTITIGYLDDDGEAGAPASNGFPAAVQIAFDADDALSIVSDEANEVHYVFSYDAGDSLYRVTGYSADFNTTTTATIEDISALPGSPDVRNVTAVLRADDSLNTFYEVDAAIRSEHYVRQSTVDPWTPGSSITVGTPAEFLRSVGLASKAFVEADEPYVGVAFDSALQPTYFIANSSAEIVARIAIGLGGGLTHDVDGVLKSGLARVDLDSNSERFYPVLIRNQVEAADDGVTLSVNAGINRVTIGFNAAEFSNAQLGQNLYIAGGLLQAYDGVAVVEEGFHVYPEDISISSGGAGGLASGTYNYRITYEWVDARGQIHQSIPSITTSYASGASDSASIDIPTLRLSAKSDVQAVIWRAIKDGVTVYYRMAEVANNPEVDTVTYVDDDSDFSTTSQILYTVGGALENSAAPASEVVHQHRNRLFLGGTEDGKIYYTREHVFGEGANFSEILSFPVDPRGGATSALASLDRNLIIMKPDATFVVSGDGPNDAGLQNDYTRPELISGDLGCANQQSLANTPDGLMMQTRDGIWLLNRALQFTYIGEQVEAFNNEEITSAVVFHEQYEVRFTTKNGPTLVYNYDIRQWSVFTNYEAEGAVLALGGTYLHLKSDGTVNQETVGAYEDNGSRIKIAIETSWLAFLGVQAYQRVYMLSLLGRWVSDHILSMKLAYDYEDAYTDTVYFATADAINGDQYGEGYYGEMITYGGSSGGKYQFRHKPSRQKCESLKIRLEDLDTVGVNGGASFSLVSMSFEVGTKTGINRFGSARTIGNG